MRVAIFLLCIAVVAVVGCAIVTVQTGVGEAAVSSEADKGVIFKPKDSVGGERK